jgi:hypothetical protein
VCQPQPARARAAGSYQPEFSPRHSPQPGGSALRLPVRRSLRRLLIKFIGDIHCGDSRLGCPAGRSPAAA